MLAMPDPLTDHPIAEWQAAEAVRLFVLRAQAITPSFTLHERNTQTVAEICWRLDGLPLAIELAAARVNVLTPKQILARLDDSLQLLTRCAPASESRHQTLRAALTWSFALLDRDEQCFFPRLAVFRGGFDLEGVEAICAGEGLGRGAVLDLLAGLVEKSLVATAEQGEEMCYRLLEPVRQYAVERLHSDGNNAYWVARHAHWYLELAERVKPTLPSLEQQSWFDRLAHEHDNLRTALAWFAQQEGNAGLRLAAALFPFWRIRGFFSEGQQWLEKFLRRADSPATTTRIDALNGLARLYIEQSNFVAAQESFAQALRLARQTAYDQGIGAALVGLGITRWELGDFPAAYTVLDEAVQRGRSTNDRPLLAKALRILALVHWSQGEIFSARSCCVESLAVARQLGDLGSIAGSLFNLAILTALQGEYGSARQLYEECLTINRQLGDRGFVADVLINLGQLTVDLGEFEDAAVYLAEASQLHQQLGDQGDMAYSLANLADIAFYRGDYAPARRQYQEALTLFRQAGNKRMVGRSLGWLGLIACCEGDLATATALCAEALTLRHAIGHKAGVVFSLEEGYAELAVALGQPAVAVRLLAVADGLYEEMSRTRPPIKARLVEKLKLKLRTHLGESAFAGAWNEGQAMSMDEAVAYALDKLSPAAMNRPRLALRIYALGPARIYRGERLLTAADWVYAKARELVFYLLCHPGATREQIGVEFWPEASSEQVRKRFSAALAHARNALGRDTEWITLVDGRYWFNRSDTRWFDVEIFEELLREARRLWQNDGPLERVIALFAEALDLYSGDFVEDIAEGEWPVARSQTLRQSYLDALLTLGCLHIKAGREEQAVALFQRALEKDPYLEEAHLELIRAYARRNQRSQALQQYEALNRALADMTATPTPETARLIERIRRGEPI
jgi:tetratricopeptide (TPR) repeat protein